MRLSGFGVVLVLVGWMCQVEMVVRSPGEGIRVVVVVVVVSRRDERRRRRDGSGRCIMNDSIEV